MATASNTFWKHKLAEQRGITPTENLLTQGHGFSGNGGRASAGPFRLGSKTLNPNRLVGSLLGFFPFPDGSSLAISPKPNDLRLIVLVDLSQLLVSRRAIDDFP